MVLPMLSRRQALTATAAVLLLTPAMPGFAQQQHPTQTQPAPRTAGKTQIDQLQASGEFKVLSKPIDLPNFPAWAGGGQFLWGNVRYRKDGGAEITMRYACTDAAAAVLGWYKQALINFHWTVGQTTERMVTARYKNMNTTIITFPSNNAQYACQLNVVFNMPKSVPSE